MKTNWNTIAQQIFFYLIGVVFLLGFFSIGIFLILRVVPPDNKEFVGGILETLKNGAILILGYFYGSSKGSADKTDLISQSTPIKPTPPITSADTTTTTTETTVAEVKPETPSL